MARPLLAPSTFLTLAGMCPACLDETRTDGGTAAPAEVVAVATAPSGNGRTPGYDHAVMRQRRRATESGVAIVAEPPVCEPGDPVAPAPVRVAVAAEGR